METEQHATRKTKEVHEEIKEEIRKYPEMKMETQDSKIHGV